jgi:hypothetical protein
MTTDAPAILDIGEVGSGKTWAISTLADKPNDLDVFVILTEPNGLESLLNAWQKKNLPIEKLHWRQVTPARVGFEGLIAQAKLVAMADQKFLSDQKPTNNRGNSKWIDLLGACHNFVCERDGKSYGSITEFDPTRAVIIDSLSGLNLMAMDVTIGDKATANPGEWGIAMKLLEKFLITLTSGLKCPLVITAHMEKELEENTGLTKIMVSTLGKKLAPTIPRFFSEVVMSYREGTEFYWSTSAANVALKNRSLPIAPKLSADYTPIIKAWKQRINFAQTPTNPTKGS